MGGRDSAFEPLLTPFLVHVHLGNAGSPGTRLWNGVKRAEHRRNLACDGWEEVFGNRIGRDSRDESVPREPVRKPQRRWSHELDLRHRNVRGKLLRDEVMHARFRLEQVRTLGTSWEAEDPAVRGQERVELPAGAKVLQRRRVDRGEAGRDDPGCCLPREWAIRFPWRSSPPISVASAAVSRRQLQVLGSERTITGLFSSG
jgi:hypothetical protein